nr:VWA domain-containing protein [Arcanobacterium phocae]
MRPHCHGRSDVPGSVKLCKTATEVPGLVNTWDVTLRVEAQELKRTSDVVLVIDRSGSMASQGRIEAAKKSAKLFVDKLLSDTSSQATRIGLVSFATNATLEKILAETRMNYMLRSMRYQPMAEPSLKPQYVKRLKC